MMDATYENSLEMSNQQLAASKAERGQTTLH